MSTQGSVLRARDPRDGWSSTKLVDLGAASIAPVTHSTNQFFFSLSSEENLQGIVHELFDS